MNSAQVDFLDFVRPRCWILALSWNELSSGRLFRLWTSMLLNPGLILKSRCRRLWTSGHTWWMHSLGRELKKKSFYIHPSTVFTDRLNLFYLPRKSPSPRARELSSRSNPRYTFKDRLKTVRSSRSPWSHFQRSINLPYVVYFQRSLKT